ncbi:hypothetical protein B7463_g7674, partial [Scytalidium lignicola]
MKYLAALSLLALGASAQTTLPSIQVQGSKFFFPNGTQFFIRGVAYQQGVGTGGASGATSDTNTQYADPLADGAGCARDIPFMKKLKTNVVRVYAVDPTQNHDDCMASLSAAGIYVIADLSEPNLSINRESPAWDTQLYSRYTSVIDSLQTYSNVIGFFAGNEVTNNASYTAASAFVKAAVRDSKAYIKSKSYRDTLYVGYAADDDQYIRQDVADYFNCGDQADAVDFWGYNIYSWCGDSSYQTSGYADRVAEFSNYSIPIFFSEYGCNTQGGGAAGREFTEVAALYGADMSKVFSGGIVYEWFQETNDYGLVSVSGNTVSTLADFNALSTQLAKVTPSSVSAAQYTPTNSALQSCPTLFQNWTVSSPNLPPTPNQDLCDCMYSSLSCRANSDISAEAVGDLFFVVCGYNDGRPCTGFTANTSTGVYGPYLGCNDTQKLSLAFDTYYKEQGSSSDACSFDGNATVVQASKASGSCTSLLSAASSSASSISSGSGTSSGSGSSSSQSSTHSPNAAARFGPQGISGSGVMMGMYVLGMAVLGGAMVVL